MTETAVGRAIRVVGPNVGFRIAKAAGRAAPRKHTVCRESLPTGFVVDAPLGASRGAVVMT